MSAIHHGFMCRVVGVVRLGVMDSTHASVQALHIDNLSERKEKANTHTSAAASELPLCEQIRMGWHLVAMASLTRGVCAPFMACADEALAQSQLLSEELEREVAKVQEKLRTEAPAGDRKREGTPHSPKRSASGCFCCPVSVGL
jgi:hypothetical protein